MLLLMLLSKSLFLSDPSSSCDTPANIEDRIAMTVIHTIEEAEALNAKLASLDLAGRLAFVAGLGGRAVFTTSLGIEDQVITAEIGNHRLPIDVVTLQTGRLFPETLTLINETESQYDIKIARYEPEQADIDAYAAKYGMNGFYESVEARHACCGVRKLKPLARALNGATIWITGLRRGQSNNRADTPFAEYDAERHLLKVNPLADWDIDVIKAYVADNSVPVNPLHARGYPSIGCEPCTRAIKPGEPERAGRWWWEQDEKRECGLHVAEEASAIPAAQ
ncbi:phosphoadenosine phosphosulfate reductase [Rhizobium sp. OAE497]